MESKNNLIAVYGTVAEIHELQNGDNWYKQSFVIRLTDKFERHLQCNVYNDQIKSFTFQKMEVNHKVKVYINVYSRMYEGKWYTEVTAWKIDIFTDIQTKEISDTNQ